MKTETLQKKLDKLGIKDEILFSYTGPYAIECEAPTGDKLRLMLDGESWTNFLENYESIKNEQLDRYNKLLEIKEHQYDASKYKIDFIHDTYRPRIQSIKIDSILIFESDRFFSPGEIVMKYANRQRWDKAEEIIQRMLKPYIVRIKTTEAVEEIMNNYKELCYGYMKRIL